MHDRTISVSDRHSEYRRQRQARQLRSPRFRELRKVPESGNSFKHWTLNRIDPSTRKAENAAKGENERQIK
jgi:hypothetical protein